MNFIIFDLEATCWENDRSKQNEIIEIGAVKVNDDLEITDTFQSFIKPKLNPILSDFCKSLTSISQEDIDKANSFSQVLYQFQKWIGKEYWLCSWGFYDKSQLKKDCELHKLDTKWLKNHISLKHQFMNTHNLQNREAGMNNALKMLGLTLDGIHHRGIDDAKNIAKIFIKEYDKWKFKV